MVLNASTGNNPIKESSHTLYHIFHTIWMSVKITKINITSYYNSSYYMSQTVSNSDSQCTDSPQLSLWHPFLLLEASL